MYQKIFSFFLLFQSLDFLSTESHFEDFLFRISPVTYYFEWDEDEHELRHKNFKEIEKKMSEIKCPKEVPDSPSYSGRRGESQRDISCRSAPAPS